MIGKISGGEARTAQRALAVRPEARRYQEKTSDPLFFALSSQASNGTDESVTSMSLRV
jgi:hypothetical protein